MPSDEMRRRWPELEARALALSKIARGGHAPVHHATYRPGEGGEWRARGGEHLHRPAADPAVFEVRRDEGSAVEDAVAVPSHPEGAFSGLEILVVDDDEDSRFFIEVALSRASVRSVDFGAAAFTVLQQRRVDVLISDIGMPEEDGFSFMHRVRALPAHKGGAVPAIALTAYARTEDASRALRVGYRQHLAKPADADALLRAVASLVERRGA